jgi:hypothetical protein
MTGLKKMGLPFTTWKSTSSFEFGPSYSFKVRGYLLAIIDGLTSSMITSSGFNPIVTLSQNTVIHPDCCKLCYKKVDIAVQNCLALRKPEIVKFSNSHADKGLFYYQGYFQKVE